MFHNCIGIAASIGIFTDAGTKGKRLALLIVNTIHQPLGGARGQATDIKTQNKF